MKKIYITSIPLDSNYIITKKVMKPVNFEAAEMETEGYYPIIPVIKSTVSEGDKVKVVIMRQENEKGRQNLDLFYSELDALGLKSVEVVDVTMKESHQQNAVLDLFWKMTEQMEDHSDYYIDMTFGPKSFAVILFSLLSYIANIRERADLKGLYYLEVLREEGQIRKSGIYDMSYLQDLNLIMSSLNNASPEKKDKVIKMLLR
jgi:hypothetical protein